MQHGQDHLSEVNLNLSPQLLVDDDKVEFDFDKLEDVSTLFSD